MGFKEITPLLRQPTIGKVRFSVRLDKHGIAKGTVIVPAPVLADLGWGNAQPLKLLVGDGPDAGRFRLTPAEKAPLRFTVFGRGGGRIGLGNFAGLPTKAMEPTNVDHNCTGPEGSRYLEIDARALTGAAYSSLMR
jgi:hypothetical protein